MSLLFLETYNDYSLNCWLTRSSQYRPKAASYLAPELVPSTPMLPTAQAHLSALWEATAIVSSTTLPSPCQERWGQAALLDSCLACCPARGPPQQTLGDPCGMNILTFTKQEHKPFALTHCHTLALESGGRPGYTNYYRTFLRLLVCKEIIPVVELLQTLSKKI